MQRGFLGGRSILANVLDVDFESMRISLKVKQGAIVLFDFAAAFPSISNTYMFTMLGNLGIPTKVINLIKALYSQVRCYMTLGGEKQEGFDQLVGIRQGCPLSPLIFAIVADVFLRRLHRLYPDDMLRA